MKRALICFLICIIEFVASGIHAQVWNTLGSRGLSGQEADYESMAIDASGTPYIAYEDFANSFKATVKKFNGSNWVTVGAAGFSTDVSNFTSIAINSTGTPYVTYQDAGDSQKITVMKYDGTGWVIVGRQGFSIGVVAFTSIAIGANDTPFVSFTDQDTTGVPKARVMKYNGSAWVSVGNARLSGTVSNGISLAMWNGAPYVAFPDSNIEATVMTWNGSNWITVGNSEFSAGEVNAITLAIDASGVPYVAYTDYANSNKATVMKYNGSWVTVGTAGFSAAEADNTTIAVDPSGTPYIAYSDGGTTDYYTTVKEYDGSNWVTVGNAGFSGSLANYVTMAIDMSGTPYVGYQDFSTSKAATVKKYIGATGIKNAATLSSSVNIFPNPNHGTFTVNISSIQNQSTTVTVTNIVGEVIKEYSATTNTNTEIQLDCSAGMYFISAITTDGRWNGKVVVE